VAATAFVVIFLGEFGDLTQLLTVNLVARTHQPWSVFTGALAALVAVSCLAAFTGQALLRVIPASRLRIGGGLVLVALGIYGVVSLIA
jgi:putative Ca2+/H+ antiporter (TMEM165/GDT1 family)